MIGFVKLDADSLPRWDDLGKHAYSTVLPFILLRHVPNSGCWEIQCHGLPTPRAFLHFPSLHALPLHTSMSKRGLRHVGSGLGGVCVHTLGRRLSFEMCMESFTFPSLLLIRSTTPMEIDTLDIYSPREWFRSHHLRFGHLSLSDHVHKQF